MNVDDSGHTGEAVGGAEIRVRTNLDIEGEVIGAAGAVGRGVGASLVVVVAEEIVGSAVGAAHHVVLTRRPDPVHRCPATVALRLCR